MLGQFIRHLLGADFPNMNIGPGELRGEPPRVVFVTVVVTAVAVDDFQVDDISEVLGGDTTSSQTYEKCQNLVHTREKYFRTSLTDLRLAVFFIHFVVFLFIYCGGIDLRADHGQVYGGDSWPGRPPGGG